MHIAVLVKQVPKVEHLRLVNGQLVREGVELEVNAYCRRANAKAVELAGDGEVVVFTMGPPSAQDALREMVACGATRALHLCDPAFAGGDTLATARALAAALHDEGPFDLVLCGLNSVDADTGQVGPQVAELLGLTFCAGARELAVESGRFTAVLEVEDGYRSVEGDLPAVISTAERLCDPSKAAPEARAAVDPGKIRTLTAHSLGLLRSEVGLSGSPTSVGQIRTIDPARSPIITTDLDVACAWLQEHSVLASSSDETWSQVVPPGGGDGPQVWCVADDHGRSAAELLGEAAVLAAEVHGSVTAVTSGDPKGMEHLGADRILVVPGAPEPERLAEALAAAARRWMPWAILVGGTNAGRHAASVVAARNGWGLVGDAISFGIDEHARLVAWKPAFGGQTVVAIHSSSPVQMATVRPGVLPLRRAREAPPAPVLELPAPGPARVLTRGVECTDPDLSRFIAAPVVVGVGQGVDPAEYERLDTLRLALGDAPLGATRKVTDRGWLPRSRQIGVTGHSISPQLYVAVGISGRFNHTVGLRNAGKILAINADPEAEIFHQCDLGLVADWRDVVDQLAGAVSLANRS